MSQKKKKKDKKRNVSDVGISIAKANIEGNDEARTLTGIAMIAKRLVFYLNSWYLQTFFLTQLYILYVISINT